MGFISGGIFGFFAGGVFMFLFYPTEWINDRSTIGYYSINSVRAECEKKRANGLENPTFEVTAKYPYEILPKDRSCNGDENDLITVSTIKDNLGNHGWLPTFIYNVKTGERSFKEW